MLLVVQEKKKNGLYSQRNLKQIENTEFTKSVKAPKAPEYVRMFHTLHQDKTDTNAPPQPTSYV